MAGSCLKNRLYEARILKSKQVRACVVSVGNIAAGGSGKTPFAMLLAQEFCDTFPTAILSRGYLSSFENGAREVKMEHGWRQIGDEVVLMRNRVGAASFFVGKKRNLSAAMAQDRGCRLLIMDDGMQYRGLFRDIEITVLDGGDPFGKKSFLRESARSLDRSDFIVINNAPNNWEMIASGLKAPVMAVRPRIISVG